MAFIPYGTLAANEGSILIGGDAVPQRTIIVNSGVMQIGDKVEWSSGFVQTGAGSTAAVDPIGICVGVAQNGIAVTPDSGTTDTFTVAGDNQTVAKKYAIIDISENSLYSVGMDDVPGTTTGSNLPGYCMNAVASDGAQLDESTVVTSDTGSASFFSWGIDPASSTRVIVNMATAQHHKLIA